MPQVFEQMPEDVLAFLEAELAFFDSVTGISGLLYSVPKDERKAGAVKLAREVRCRAISNTTVTASVFYHLWPCSQQQSLRASKISSGPAANSRAFVHQLTYSWVLLWCMLAFEACSFACSLSCRGTTCTCPPARTTA